MNEQSAMTTSRGITRAEWQEFLNGFSRKYVGKQVTMRLMTSNIHASHTTTVQTFGGIWTNNKGPQTGDVMVGLDSTEGGNLTRTFAADTHLAPTHLHWQEVEQTLTIELADGSTVFLQF
jgi:hypothetical protein